MDDEKHAQEATQWKQKYLDNLEESERSEKQWKDSDELLRKTISRLTLAADGLDETLDKQLRELRNAIRDHSSTSQLRTRIDEMSKTLVRLDQGGGKKKGEKQDTPEQTGESGGFLKRLFGAASRQVQDEDIVLSADQGSPDTQVSTETVSDILVQLLERLTLPEEFSPHVERIREHILGMTEGGHWDSVLEEIADLVQAIRAQSLKEKQGIEEFLKQLGKRLEEVDRQLVQSEVYYDDSLQAGLQLDSQVKQEITGIGDSVRGATDLGQLRQTVQAHIDAVMQHMTKHRVVEQQRYDEAKQEIASMSERMKDMEAETEALRSRIDDERSQAKTDALTGVPNRLAWEERLELEIAHRKRFGTPLVLVMWDVDHFKQVNDRFGHKAGDKVLRTLAHVLADNVRETDFVARYGGEEFVQLMTGSSIEDCLSVAEKLRSAIEETAFHFRDQRVTITASCGLTEYRDGDTPDQCFERADKALYKAKNAGRNRCVSD
ncbi:diguanylate cyclase [Thiogranum longum]|uniref:diguanylate cyclase n=1 Tax=Thiogranum longum TaxID=1537524 RepID=A0A4R1H9X9_9GAMM|nr:GGDEF domain-containing protein [Thiogranum longum]TCK16955.1 diguanylate cyclase [Thiogranum longum]